VKSGKTLPCGRLPSNSIDDKRQRMPYAFELYIYLFVACLLGVVIAVGLALLGILVNLIFAFSAAFLASTLRSPIQKLSPN